MKISEVTIDNLKDYARVLGNDEDTLFTSILSASKAYIKSYTGLTDEQIDDKADFVIALMVLCNEMYEVRQYTVVNDKVNVVVKSILDRYCVNLL